MNIGEPKRSKISALPWVTPDFIRDHVLVLGQGDKIGLAILRIESNENPPKAIAKNNYAQQQLDEIRAGDEPDTFGCFYLIVVGQNKHGADITKYCRAETSGRFCAEHGGAI